jgi:hypothetical protein
MKVAAERDCSRTGLFKMFGFGRRRAIDERAKSLGELMILLVGSLDSMAFDEFIAANRRRGFVEGHVQAEDFGIDREYSFFESEPQKADFSFHAIFPKSGTRTLIAEGHKDYFGLVLCGYSGRRDIGADIKRRSNQIRTQCASTSIGSLKVSWLQQLGPNL